MKIAPALALAAALGLAACGQQSPAENTAAALESAAEQSTPEAAAVLENQAEQIREQNVTAPIGEPGSPGQQALQAAGKAQAQNSAAAARQAPPPPKGAKPHAKGDPVPPPQIMPPEDANATHAGH
jgi:hypothetical protein